MKIQTTWQQLHLKSFENKQTTKWSGVIAQYNNIMMPCEEHPQGCQHLFQVSPKSLPHRPLVEVAYMVRSANRYIQQHLGQYFPSFGCQIPSAWT